VKEKIFRVTVEIMTKGTRFYSEFKCKKIPVKEWVELGKELGTLSKKN
jgi:hypothetical protein